MRSRFKIDEPLTPRERLFDYALATLIALIVVGLVSGVVALALLGMAE